MIEIKGTVPCSVCGEYPFMQGGLHSHAARLVCPNYKNKEIQHGNNELVDAWNRIHNKKEN